MWDYLKQRQKQAVCEQEVVVGEHILSVYTVEVSSAVSEACGLLTVVPSASFGRLLCTFLSSTKNTTEHAQQGTWTGINSQSEAGG